MHIYLRLLRLLKPYLGIFTGAAVCMVISNIFSIAEMGTIPIVIDRVLTDQPIAFAQAMPSWLEQGAERLNTFDRMTLLKFMMIILPSLFFLKGFAVFGHRYLISLTAQSVAKNMQDRIYAKLQALSMSFYSKQRTGELTSRITYDVTFIKNAVNENLSDLIFQTLQAFSFLAMVFFIHARLALNTFVLVPAILLPVILVGRRLRSISTQEQAKMADIHSRLFETISGIRIIKAFSMERYELDKFKAETHLFKRLVMKSVKRMVSIAPLTEFSGVLCGAAIVYFGGKEVLAGNLSAGVFGVFVVYLLSLMKPLKKLARCHAINQQVVAAGKRVFTLLDEAVEIQDEPGAQILAPIRQGITLEDVRFSFSTGREVLTGISCDIRAGEVVAFVGPSGVGKTTLVSLIPRFYDPTHGTIKVDGVDIRRVTLKSLRSQIGIVTQETILFNDTALANIAYGQKEIDRGRVEEAARQANAHRFISALPQGYDTLIGERGVKLSGGERQRLSIARALLKNPPILILDEATSHLDTESERLVQQAIDRLMKNRTCLVVAHRLSTIRNASRIFVLEEGAVREVGTHNELMEKGGRYKAFYQIQAQDISN